MRELIDALVDADSFLEVQKRWAKELIVGYARIEGRAIGIVANQPKQRGGVLFVDSADKAARFIWTCNAFNIPLLFLADVPGFMIGTQVERQGIIRAGAKMISAVSEATVPKLSVIVRKAYGAGLYAMAGPAFDPDACIALPNAKIAVMGPQAAINAVFYNQLQAIEDDEERAPPHRGAARRVQRGDRHPPPRLGAGDRRGRAAGRPAPRAREAVRRLRVARPRAGRRSATRSRPSRPRRRGGHQLHAWPPGARTKQRAAPQWRGCSSISKPSSRRRATTPSQSSTTTAECPDGRHDRVVVPLEVDLGAVALDPRGALAERLPGGSTCVEADDAPEALRGGPILASELEGHVLEHA